MDAKLQKEIKEYLSKNLTLDYEITADIYDVNPDQIVIRLLLEGEVINEIKMYDLHSY